ncbi:MAG: lasso peptide biosynthesis B2 protein [Candidatus Binatia bacterium]
MTVFRRLLALPRRDRLAILEAAALALVIEGGLRLLPFPTLMRLLGISMNLTRSSTPSGPPVWSHAELTWIRAVERLFRHWPLQGGCLRRSLLLGSGLKSRQPVLHIGVARSGGSVEAHAWLDVGGIELATASPSRRFAALRPAASPERE